jgi:hypothetical protein
MIFYHLITLPLHLPIFISMERANFFMDDTTIAKFEDKDLTPYLASSIMLKFEIVDILELDFIKGLSCITYSVKLAPCV